MPRGDRTGPNGMGAMTGRAAGFCPGGNTSGYANPAFGCGCGLGRGFGRGLGRRGGYSGAVPSARPYAAPSRPNELSALKGEAEYLGDALQNIERRIVELESKD